MRDGSVGNTAAPFCLVGTYFLDLALVYVVREKEKEKREEKKKI